VISKHTGKPQTFFSSYTNPKYYVKFNYHDFRYKVPDQLSLSDALAGLVKNSFVRNQN